jgi:glycerol-3-phosphate dehydrogenase
VKDLLSSETHTIKAKVFINATGPFADHIRAMANPKLPPRMRVSRGSHVMLPKEVISGNTAILVPKTDDGRVVFIIPYQNQLLVGTTDIEDELSENPYPTDDEKAYLIDYVNRYLAKPVTIDQVKSGFCGLRPLLQARLHSAMDTDTKSIVRDHEVEIDNRSKLVSIMGGKWTTYRLMAKDTIDDIYREIWETKPVPCSTENQLLCGAENYRFEDWESIANTHQIDPDIAQHLQKKYGSRTEKVLAFAQNMDFLKERIVADYPFIKAEVLYNVQEEMACTVEDIVVRRLGLMFLDEKAAKLAEPIVEELLLGYKLGSDRSRF